jgi:hypothetical protein
MSKTVFIDYRGRYFGAFDVITKVLLKYLIDVAAPLAAREPWLALAVDRWRVDAELPSEFGFYLDDAWTQEQIDVFCRLLESACQLLHQREAIPAQEIEGWEVLGEDRRQVTRGIPLVPTKPVIMMGQAIIALVLGKLTPPPLGYWWWYTTEDTPQAIQRKLFPCTIAILEDDHERQQAMRAAVDEELRDGVCFFFASARQMIEWLCDWLSSKAVSPPALISLRCDLEFLPGPDGKGVDPGDERDVARYLATLTPFCPIIIHTRDNLAATSMTCTLQDAGWDVARVHPEADSGWIRSRWIKLAYRLAWEWREKHAGELNEKR